MFKPRGKPNNAKRRSFKARLVAEKIMANICLGKRTVLRKVLLESGYSDAIARQPKKVTDTLSYKETVAPFVEALISLRDKAINALDSKDLAKENLSDLTILLKEVARTIALSQNKATEKFAHKLEVVLYGSDDFLLKQLK